MCAQCPRLVPHPNPTGLCHVFQPPPGSPLDRAPSGCPPWPSLRGRGGAASGPGGLGFRGAQGGQGRAQTLPSLQAWPGRFSPKEERNRGPSIEFQGPGRRRPPRGTSSNPSPSSQGLGVMPPQQLRLRGSRRPGSRKAVSFSGLGPCCSACGPSSPSSRRWCEGHESVCVVVSRCLWAWHLYHVGPSRARERPLCAWSCPWPPCGPCRTEAPPPGRVGLVSPPPPMDPRSVCGTCAQKPAWFPASCADPGHTQAVKKWWVGGVFPQGGHFWSQEQHMPVRCPGLPWSPMSGCVSCCQQALPQGTSSRDSSLRTCVRFTRRRRSGKCRRVI